MSITFNINDYSVKFDGVTIELLRKEFLLLDYLYKNANKTLSREQLLQSVWPLQVPSDRTVDDHIYRLRKKLKLWEKALTFETVKGLGYRLTIHESSISKLSLPQDKEFQQLTTNLIHKYHLYGHGEAIEHLIEGQTFGIQMEERFHSLIKFLHGDFSSILHSKTLTDKEKALPLFWLFFMLEKDIRTIKYFFNALEEKQFFLDENKEEVDLFRILFEIKQGNVEHARSILIENESVVTREVIGFYGFYQISWLALAIYKKDWVLAQEKIEILHHFFEQHPFQREYGLFLTLKGIYFLFQKKKSTGLDLLSSLLRA